MPVVANKAYFSQYPGPLRLYHCTHKDKLPVIEAKGLLPKNECVEEEYAHYEPRVFLAMEFDELEHEFPAMVRSKGWRRDDLVILGVNVPKDFPLSDDPDCSLRLGSLYTNLRIPPRWIKEVVYLG